MRWTATLAIVLVAVGLGGFSLELARPTSVTANAAMPDPGLTGAPSEGSCFSCHSGALNDLNGGIVILNVPAQYTPGQVYPIGVILAQSTSSRWGFEITALTAGGQMAGTLDDNNNNVGQQTQGGITYVSQTTQKGFDGTYSDSLGGAVWTMSWTAPPVGTGPVTFYAAGAACNKDNAADAGDFTYTTQSSSTEGAPTSVEATTWGKLKMIYR